MSEFAEPVNVESHINNSTDCFRCPGSTPNICTKRIKARRKENPTVPLPIAPMSFSFFIREPKSPRTKNPMRGKTIISGAYEYINSLPTNYFLLDNLTTS